MKKSKSIKQWVPVFLAFCFVFATANGYSQMTPPSDGSRMVMSKYNFGETVDILQGAIEEQNLMVIHVIDGQRMLRMAGKETGGMKQIFYFHPKYMKRVMEANKDAMIQIPLKLIVMEMPNGKTAVRYFMPSTILNEYTGEEKIAEELDELISIILGEISK
jgi:uncharacterized protein (DUF302 family)